jgi:hypothetical protein
MKNVLIVDDEIIGREEPVRRSGSIMGGQKFRLPYKCSSNILFIRPYILIEIASF